MSTFLNNGWLRCSSVLCTLVLLAGCSWFSNDEELKAATELPPLEVPPDLIRPYGDDKLVSPVPTTSPQQTQGEKTPDCRCDDRLPRIGERVLPQGKGVQRLREGQHRWLLVSAEPEQVWPLAQKFLEMRGYRIHRNEPAVGLMETDWKNVFDDPGEGKTDAIPTQRERLRLRLEPGQQPDRTEVYLSLYRSERVKMSGVSPDSNVDTGVDKSEEKNAQWQFREPDTDRAIEMLNRLAQYLAGENVDDAVPLTPIVSKLGSDGDGGKALIVEDDFARVWRRTGIALDALGFVIEDRNRESRTYNVYNEITKGKTKEELEHGKPESATVREEYRIQLDQVGEKTLLTIRTKDGQVDNSDVAVHVLNLLHSQFQ